MDPEPAGLGEGWAYLATLKGVSSLWLQNQLQAIPKAVAIEISMYEVFVNNDAENSKGSAKNRKCNQGFRWLTQRVCSQGLMLSPRRRRCTQTSIVHPMLDCGPGCAVFAELRRRSESQVADVFRHRRHEAEYKAGSGPSKSSEEIRIDDKRWRHTFYYSKPNARPRLKIPAQLYLSFFEKSFSDKSNVICQWDQGTVVGRADYRLFPVPRPNRTMEICTRGTGLLSEKKEQSKTRQHDKLAGVGTSGARTITIRQMDVPSESAMEELRSENTESLQRRLSPYQMHIIINPPRETRPGDTLVPPPTVSLRLRGTDGNQGDLDEDINSYWAFVSVVSEDCLTALAPPSTTLLTGTLVGSIREPDATENEGDVGYVVFQNLVINQSGNFRLRISLQRMPTQDSQASDASGSVPLSPGVLNTGSVVSSIIRVRYDAPAPQLGPPEDSILTSLQSRGIIRGSESGSVIEQDSDSEDE